MKSYGYSPAWGVSRTEPEPEPASAPALGPADPPARPRKRRSRRRESRLHWMASWRLHDGPEDTAPFGFITAREAAARLGVTPRTVERYKRELSERKAT